MSYPTPDNLALDLDEVETLAAAGLAPADILAEFLLELRDLTAGDSQLLLDAHARGAALRAGRLKRAITTAALAGSPTALRLAAHELAATAQTPTDDGGPPQTPPIPVYEHAAYELSFFAHQDPWDDPAFPEAERGRFPHAVTRWDQFVPELAPDNPHVRPAERHVTVARWNLMILPDQRLALVREAPPSGAPYAGLLKALQGLRLGAEPDHGPSPKRIMHEATEAYAAELKAIAEHEASENNEPPKP